MMVHLHTNGCVHFISETLCTLCVNVIILIPIWLFLAKQVMFFPSELLQSILFTIPETTAIKKERKNKKIKKSGISQYTSLQSLF